MRFNTSKVKPNILSLSLLKTELPLRTMTRKIRKFTGEKRNLSRDTHTRLVMKRLMSSFWRPFRSPKRRHTKGGEVVGQDVWDRQNPKTLGSRSWVLRVTREGPKGEGHNTDPVGSSDYDPFRIRSGVKKN